MVDSRSASSIRSNDSGSSCSRASSRSWRAASTYWSAPSCNSSASVRRAVVSTSASSVDSRLRSRTSPAIVNTRDRCTHDSSTHPTLSTASTPVLVMIAPHGSTLACRAAISEPRYAATVGAVIAAPTPGRSWVVTSIGITKKPSTSTSAVQLCSERLAKNAEHDEHEHVDEQRQPDQPDDPFAAAQRERCDRDRPAHVDAGDHVAGDALVLGRHGEDDRDNERRQRQAQQQLHTDAEKRVLEQDPVEPAVIAKVGEPERRRPIRRGRRDDLRCRRRGQATPAAAAASPRPPPPPGRTPRASRTGAGCVS